MVAINVCGDCGRCGVCDAGRTLTCARLGRGVWVSHGSNLVVKQGGQSSDRAVWVSHESAQVSAPVGDECRGRLGTVAARGFDRGIRLLFSAVGMCMTGVFWDWVQSSTSTRL